MTSNHDVPTAELAAALQGCGATVTEFLEQLVGEPIVAEIECQFMAPAIALNELDLDVDSQVMHRSVVLQGSTTACSLVVAHSLIAVHRLPGAARRRLLESQDPIGRVLVAHGIDAHRKPVHGPVEYLDGSVRSRRQASKAVMARRYLIIADHRPVFDVREWFLPTVLDMLARRGADRAEG